MLQARRGGLGLLLALTAPEEEGGRKGLVAWAGGGAEGGGAEGGGEGGGAEAVMGALQGVPRLPEALASSPLFRAQAIEADGFGVAWRPVEGAPRLRVSALRAAVTRKTLMPAVAALPGAT